MFTLDYESSTSATANSITIQKNGESINFIDLNTPQCSGTSSLIGESGQLTSGAEKHISASIGLGALAVGFAMM